MYSTDSRSNCGIVLLAVIDVRWLAIRARGIDANDIVGSSSYEFPPIRSVREDSGAGWI